MRALHMQSGCQSMHAIQFSCLSRSRPARVRASAVHCHTCDGALESHRFRYTSASCDSRHSLVPGQCVREIHARRFLFRTKVHKLPGFRVVVPQRGCIWLR